MLSAFVSKRDFDVGKAFIVVIDDDAENPVKYYYSPKQIDELCERLQLAKLQAIHGPTEYR